MNFSGTESTAVLIGSIDGNVTRDQVYARLAADAPDLEAFDIQEISSDAGKLCLAVVCLKSQAQQMEEALRMQGFARPAQLVSEVPAQELQNLKDEVERIHEETGRIQEKIRSFILIRITFSLFRIIFGSVHRSTKYWASSASQRALFL